MTKPKRYKRYSSEFKREAILRGGEEGSTDTAVCEELGISTRQFRRWRDELQLLGDDAFPGHGRTRDEDLTALKRELGQVKKERDFLREAAAYFAKRSR
jgi:transposase